MCWRASTVQAEAEDISPGEDVLPYHISGFRVEAKGSTDQIEVLLAGLGSEGAGLDLALEEIEMVQEQEGERWVVRLLTSVLGTRE